jgi:hypothetical protein
VLLLHLLLRLDKLYGRREQRGCETAAGASEEYLGERWLFVARSHLHLQ